VKVRSPGAIGGRVKRCSVRDRGWFASHTLQHAAQLMPSPCSLCGVSPRLSLALRSPRRRGAPRDAAGAAP